MHGASDNAKLVTKERDSRTMTSSQSSQSDTKPDDQKALPEQAYALGFEYERTYGSCSQSVFAAVQETLFGKVVDEAVFKAAHPFTGGGSITGQAICGALAGGMLAIGCFCGREYSQFSQGVFPRVFAVSKRLHDKFMTEFGSCLCPGVQTTIMGRSFNFWDKSDFAAFEAAGGHVDKCTNVVGKAAMWTVEILLDEQASQPLK